MYIPNKRYTHLKYIYIIHIETVKGVMSFSITTIIKHLIKIKLINNLFIFIDCLLIFKYVVYKSYRAVVVGFIINKKINKIKEQQTIKIPYLFK